MSGKKQFFPILSTGWQFAGGYRLAMVGYVLLYILAQAVALIEPYVIGMMLNTVQADLAAGAEGTAHLVSDVTRYMSMYLAIRLGFWAIHGPTRLLERRVAFHITYAYKAHMYNCVTNLPLKWQREHHSGESIDRINRATSALFDFFQNSFELIYMVCRLVGTFLILFWFMKFAAIAVLVTTVLTMTTIVLFDRVLSKQYTTLNKLQNYIAEALHDYVTNVVTVITLRLQNRTLEEVKRRMRIPFPLFMRNNALNEWKWGLTAIMIVLMTAVVLIYYAHTTISSGQVLLAGTFFALFDYLRRIGDSFYNFASQYGRVVRMTADVKSAALILEAAETLVPKGIVGALPRNWHQLSVRGLTFSYDQERDARQNLTDVAIDLEKGKTVAIVGESGSGKSTLLRVLRGLDLSDRGEVFVDGTRLEHNLRHLAAVTTLMPQDPEIFADTIRFNIAFGMDASDEDILEAIRIARFDPVLARLPKGLDTNIAERGINLSGGEKQRLALARGVFFARDSDILLLDEPTSSVDSMNERAIYTTLLSRFKDRCLISSIHKLHLLELFDRIYVFKDGKVVESGSFVELTKREDGVFKTMWQNYQSASRTADAGGKKDGE